MSVKFHEGQSQIAKSRKRFKVVACGRRWGKTTLAIWDLIMRAGIHPDLKLAYIAPTYQQARDIAWAELKNLAQDIAKTINESRLEITLKNGSKISLRGWEAVETLRGQSFDFIVIDEIAMMRNFEEKWQEVIRPTLTDRKGEVLFISTPKGFNHFYKLFNTKDKDYESWHFTSFDNPYLPKEEIEKAKEELTEDSFAQEYLADFRKSVGLAHPYWDRKIHLIKEFSVPKDWLKGRGFDYGSTDPTASLRCAINDKNWILERSYKQAGQDIETHAKTVMAQDFNESLVPAWGDPSGAQWFTEFQKHGLFIQPANKESGGMRSWVEYGVEKINQLLKPVPGHTVIFPNGEKIENAPHFFVFDTPENQAFVKEIESLRWKETTEGVTVNLLDEYADPNGHSDLMASLRYLVVSWEPQNKFKISDLPQFQKQTMYE